MEIRVWNLNSYFYGEVSIKSHVQILILKQDIVAYVRIKLRTKILCEKDNFTPVLTTQFEYL